MESCDVLVVGGGPAGSSCAWKLRQAGVDVVVMDRAVFPRDKICAGWITPQVIDDLALDVDHYRRGRTFQPITGFRTGLIETGAAVETNYRRPVSYGIRRCEFDHYLLERSGARVRLGESVTSLDRGHQPGGWIVNGAVHARMLVGAGGHFCPVARWLNPPRTDGAVVVAQEAECSLAPGDAEGWRIAPEQPELYFTEDLNGYGWCFRKEGFVNIGFGQIGGGPLPGAVAEFVAFLRAQRRIPARGSWAWRGHAYLVSEPPSRTTIGEGVLLSGDAAGLAAAQSGEGIRPAVESGLLAADTICEAGGDYAEARLEPYAAQLRTRFGASFFTRLVSRSMLPALCAPLLPQLFRVPWCVRHLLLNRAFLQAATPALAGGSAGRTGFGRSDFHT